MKSVCGGVYEHRSTLYDDRKTGMTTFGLAGFVDVAASVVLVVGVVLESAGGGVGVVGVIVSPSL